MINKIDLESSKIIDSIEEFKIPCMSDIDIVIDNYPIKLYTSDNSRKLWVSDNLTECGRCVFRFRSIDCVNGLEFMLIPNFSVGRLGTIYLVNNFDFQKFTLVDY